MAGTHNELLVALSVVIAAVASFTALSLAGRVRTAVGAPRRLWLAAAAISLGGGIWSMHFVAMLAFSIPGMEMSYDPALTLLSLAIALVFTGAGFVVLNRGPAAPARLVAAGLLMGSGVLAMHYLGMAAMRMPATLSYTHGWFAASALIALGAAVTAVWLASRDQQTSHRLIAACVMGVAIAGMHYAGMRAAVFTATGVAGFARADAGIGRTYLAGAISAVTLLILMMALGGARLEAMLHNYARREARALLRVEVADLLRGSDITHALRQVAALLGAYFQVARAGYGQLDAAADAFDYDVCWTDGTVPPLLGRVPNAAFDPAFVAALSAGRTVVVDDLLAVARDGEPPARRAAAAGGTRAILVVPFLREGALRSIVYLNGKTPRRWRRQDVAFMEEIAERTRQVVERVAAEEQLRELNATLEQKVAAEVDARMRTEEALRQSQKVEAIGQLTGGVAHDFNNLLTVIRGSVDLLRRPNISAERRDHYIDAIAETADRAARLTGQLLAFARRQVLQPEVFDVTANLRAVREMIGTLVGSRITISLVAADEACLIDADPSQFDTALVNMAVNARDAMDGAGEIAFTVGTTARMPALRAHPAVEGDFVTVAVRDSGRGIAAGDLDRIFEPFFTTKGVGEGTGLGLSQVFGFAKQSGGDILVESEPGQGTTFTLFLPRAAARPVGAAPAEPSADPGARAGTCVLVVEDNADVGRFATSTLAELGYSTVYAANADEALAQLGADAARFDVLFSDVVMPGMSGLELGRIVRARYPALPVLLTSGYSHVLAEEGSSGFALLQKPYSIDQLSRALARAVASSPMRDRAEA